MSLYALARRRLNPDHQASARIWVMAIVCRTRLMCRVADSPRGLRWNARRGPLT